MSLACLGKAPNYHPPHRHPWPQNGWNSPSELQEKDCTRHLGASRPLNLDAEFWSSYSARKITSSTSPHTSIEAVSFANGPAVLWTQNLLSFFPPQKSRFEWEIVVFKSLLWQATALLKKNPLICWLYNEILNFHITLTN